mmetsp:Transcript_3600/g.13123  ORF Transcript_3600/g.13123 Transcript_3600/m.13123 type:complete len:471 (-) Transcript_3600:3243-4655(-)
MASGVEDDIGIEMGAPLLPDQLSADERDSPPAGGSVHQPPSPRTTMRDLMIADNDPDAADEVGTGYVLGGIPDVPTDHIDDTDDNAAAAPAASTAAATAAASTYHANAKRSSTPCVAADAPSSGDATRTTNSGSSTARARGSSTGTMMCATSHRGGIAATPSRRSRRSARRSAVSPTMSPTTSVVASCKAKCPTSSPPTQSCMSTANTSSGRLSTATMCGMRTHSHSARPNSDGATTAHTHSSTACAAQCAARAANSRSSRACGVAAAAATALHATYTPAFTACRPTSSAPRSPPPPVTSPVIPLTSLAVARALRPTRNGAITHNVATHTATSVVAVAPNNAARTCTLAVRLATAPMRAVSDSGFGAATASSRPSCAGAPPSSPSSAPPASPRGACRRRLSVSRSPCRSTPSSKPAASASAIHVARTARSSVERGKVNASDLASMCTMMPCVHGMRMRTGSSDGAMAAVM